MLRVKVCGITRREDALAATALGADALGFIFYPKSPRYITAELAGEIISTIPQHVSRIGVYVAPDPQQIMSDVDRLGLTAVQIHGNYRPEDYLQIGALRLVFAVQVGPQFDSNQLADLQGKCAAILLDGFKSGEYGGTGKTVNRDIAAGIARVQRTILAGGLGPHNIRQAVKSVSPYAVDINSGVESAPGIKSKDKLVEVFHQIKEYRDGWKPDTQARFPLA